MMVDSAKDRRSRAREDLALVRRCRAGDEEARTELVKSHLNQVRLTLYRIIGPNQEMPDLIQNALIEVMRSLEHYRGDALLRTWIDRVCANVAYQYLRKRRGPAHVALELVPEPTDEATAANATAESRLEGRRLVETLTRLLDDISPKKRIALLLHTVLGYSVKEVAAMTDSRVATTKSRILYGRRELLRLARRDPALREWLATTGVAG
jgi:RNA polymerase sigma factor (sigma-70 family)